MGGSTPAGQQADLGSSHKVLAEPESALQRESIGPPAQVIADTGQLLRLLLAAKELRAPVLRTVQSRSRSAVLSLELRWCTYCNSLSCFGLGRCDS
ncbi:hypothetical protein NDU88_006144 [Pleurodeles waltl]|uniref:Uncharacterized protein n=1 Tax=Pleurodeles waltl TaxID=8319 RepID=A0AAV7LZC3_PLEWA|nr:hypothetical protein NDU88_006144 [Pleurodeles waltl]